MRKPGGPPFTITEDEPTPIVSDFEAFVDAVEAPSVYLTGSRLVLDRATLHALDGLMRTHRTDTHPRTDQKYYPLLNLFQRICLAARLHAIDKVKGRLRMGPTERLTEFRGLTPTERYVALLAALWVDCDWSELLRGGRGFSVSVEVELAIETLLNLPAGERLDVRALGRKGLLLAHGQNARILRLLSFFGFLDYAADPEPEIRPGFRRKDEFVIRRLKVSKLGSHFLRALHRDRPLLPWNIPDQKELGAWPLEFPGQSFKPGDGGVEKATPFCETLLPLVPVGSLRKGLPRPLHKLKEGTFVFKVGRGRTGRRIALSHEHTLEDLHLAIQGAFDLDRGHMYAFFMDGRRWSGKAYHDPRDDEPPFADEAKLGELDLFVHQRILYLYDFGACCEFDVELLEITDRPHKGRPKVMERKGGSPKR